MSSRQIGQHRSMSDRRLKVFHTVAKLLSFTKAAEALHMTQPAVTFQVRQIEEYFNTRLFDRTHNKVNLTPAGERVCEFAERIFDLYSEMENSVRDITGEIGGALTVGAAPPLQSTCCRRYSENSRTVTPISICDSRFRIPKELFRWSSIMLLIWVW